MTTTLTAEVAPCGGIVILQMESDQTGAWTLTRTPTSSDVPDPYVLYSGPPIDLLTSSVSRTWVDYGDGTNLPLESSLEYTWTFTAGTEAETRIATPALTIVVAFDDYLRLFVRVLQSGVANVLLPTPTDGSLAIRNRPNVIISMPLVGSPTLPVITINNDLTAQDDSTVPIGRGVNTDTTRNMYQITELVRRRFKVTILVSSTDEREFWTWVVLALFKSVLIDLLLGMGQNITSGFQAAASQVNDPPPGFYFADIMLEFTGDFPVRITTNYPVVEGFEIKPNGSDDGF